MSTHATIAIKTNKGYKAIYNHFDGDSLYETLTQNYTDENKVNALIALGDISFLGEEIGPAPIVKAHGFDALLTDYFRGLSKEGQKKEQAEYYHHTLAYGRDRGETGTEAHTVKSLRELIKEEECTYVFDPHSGEWDEYEYEDGDLIR